MTVPQLTPGETATLNITATLLSISTRKEGVGERTVHAFQYPHPSGVGYDYVHVDLKSAAVKVQRQEPGADVQERTLAESIRGVCDSPNYDDSGRVRVIRSIVDTFSAVTP